MQKGLKSLLNSQTRKKEFRRIKDRLNLSLLGLYPSQKYRPFIEKLFAIRSTSTRKWVFKNIVWQDESPCERQLAEKSDCLIFLPAYNETTSSSISVTTPEIRLYKLQQVIVKIYSSHFVTENSVLMDRLPHVAIEKCNYATGAVRYHNDQFALTQVEERGQLKLDQAIFLGGNGAWNYYHWTIEIIPKLAFYLNTGLIEQSIPILVPIEAQQYESFRVLLEIFLGDRVAQLIYLNKKASVRVNTLYTISPPNNLVFNIQKSRFLPDYVYFSKPSLLWVREQVLAHLAKAKNNESCHSINRIFLARKQGSARSYNQDEIIQCVAQFGFQPVYLEDLNFIEQVYLFAHAEFIIGASGAAWTNIIYCRPNTQAISWLPRNLEHFSVYSTLANYFECKMHFLHANEFKKHETHSAYHLDSADLKTLLTALI